MSDFVPHKRERTEGTLARHYKSQVREIEFAPGAASVVSLADGRKGRGSCLGCGSIHCIELNSAELALDGALNDFPGDPSVEVCPTGAIVWDSDARTASILASHCIGCGLCVARCPYGAISLKNGTTAEVECGNSDELVENNAATEGITAPKRTGRIALLTAPAAANVPTSVESLTEAGVSILIRNLLNQVGFRARTRRRGDNNMRIDVVGHSRSGRPFVAEIELGNSVLESPRALLEDIAVLHSRYGFETTDVDAISIMLAFPNVRSEYYQVTRDIQRVLGLQFRSVTVGALIALAWNLSRLDGFGEKDFAIGDGKIDLVDSLGLEFKIAVEPYLAAFTPAR